MYCSLSNALFHYSQVLTYTTLVLSRVLFGKDEILKPLLGEHVVINIMHEIECSSVPINITLIS